MENGVDAAKEGALRLESACIGSESFVKDSADESREENEAFEEAATDQESFYTPAFRHRASDSEDSEGATFDAVESGDGFDCQNGEDEDSEELDAQVSDMPAFQHGASDSEGVTFDATESGDGFDPENGEDEDLVDNSNAFEEEMGVSEELVGDRSAEEAVEFADTLNAVDEEMIVSEKLDVQVSDQNADEQEIEAFQTKSNGVEADGVTGDALSELRDDAEEVSESGLKELTEEKLLNGEYNGTILDPGRVALSEEVENGVPLVDDNLNVVEQEIVVPEEVVLVTDHNIGEQIEVYDEGDHNIGEQIEVYDEGEDLEAKSNGTEADGMTEEASSVPHDDGESMPDNGTDEFAEGSPQNGEHRDAVLDLGHGVLHEGFENGVSHVATIDTESNGGNPTDQGVEHMANGSAGFNSSSDEQTCNTQSLSVQPPSTLPEIDNGVTSRTYASVVKEGASEGNPNQAKAEGSSSGNSPEVNENLDREPVSVKDVSTSSSIDDEDNTTPTQLMMTTPTTAPTRVTESYEAPSLPSRPAGLGSSEASENFGRDSVLVEDASESSSTDEEDNSTSTQPLMTTPTGAPTHVVESSSSPYLPARPAGLGSSAPLLEPASRPLQQPRANGVAPQRQSQLAEEPTNNDPEENDETRQKLQMIRVKFLRLAHRLGQTIHNVVVAQVLYRLGLAEQLRRNTNRPGVFSFDRASVMAEQLEATGKDPLDFSCTIMVIGKTGVGKSATINSIFDEVKFQTDAFQVATKKVQDIVGTVQGIKVRIIDTPGLFPSSSDQWRNEKILCSVKKFISKNPPDIVLYFDRLDMQSRDHGDVPLLRSITDVFGSSIWFNAIIVLTHAASAPPDGPNGTPLSYEMFVSQRSHVVQQAIRQAAQDLRLMNPVSLVENHSACRMNRAGQRVLPNGQVWKPHLLLLSFASKILAEANMLLQLQDAPSNGRPFGARPRAPPLPFFLSSLLQSRPQLKLAEEQFGDDFNGDEDLDEGSDSEDGFDYDELPPFKSLNKSQLAKLSKAQKKAYFEELDYREKLFYKKQLKEEKIRRKLMKKMAEATKDRPTEYDSENVEDENSGPASVPVPMPDFVLPASFDSDNPTHRYRFLDTSNQWVVRPVLENHVWDHDVGYDGLNVERLFAIKDKIPVSVSGQLTKDKKECTFQMELASSIKHSESTTSSLGLDMQTIGKDMAYTLRGETRIKNFRRNNTAAGASFTLLGDAMSAGVKIEDSLVVNKRFKLLMSGGAMAGRGDVAYGGRLEATLRDKDYPIGRALSTLALSVVDWHGDLAIGYNLQSQIPIGRGTNVVGHANLNNKGTGQVGIRLNSSDQLQIALLALVPLFRHVKRMLFGSSQQFE